MDDPLAPGPSSRSPHTSSYATTSPSRAAATSTSTSTSTSTNANANANAAYPSAAPGPSASANEASMMVMDVEMNTSNGTTTEESSAAVRARAATGGVNGTTVNGFEPGQRPAAASASKFEEDTDSSSDSSTSSKPPSSIVYTSSDKIVHRAFRPPTGYCYSTKMTYHAYVGANDEDVHPELPDRIVGIHQRLQDAGLLSRMERIAIREAVKAEATLVHSTELWHKVNSFAQQSNEFYNVNRLFFSRLSLYVNEHTALCARLSLGGVIETCRAVAEERIGNAFAIVRPPGHHAEPEQAMGFCFYNNVAVAAAYLKTAYADRGIRKILILDWDVHHGNGTQKAFWSDPDVLYISIHRYDNGEFYPGGSYGGADMVGAEGAEGRCVNIPWPSGGMTDADYIAAFQRIIMPIAYEFRPDFVLVSAGFDAAEGDQLGGCHVSPTGYAHMTHMLSALAKGRMVIALEGGYNVDSIAKSALECVKVLLGETPPEMPALVAQSAAVRAIHLVTEEQSRYWKCIQPTFPRRNELASAGKITPITEILKAHRTHHLYHTYGMYNVPIADSTLEQTFKDQLLVSDNIFSATTLVLLAHDMGNLRVELEAMTADVQLAKSFLLDTSKTILDWTKQNKWALVDVNLLAHSDVVAGTDRQRIAQRERQLILHVWDTIVNMAANIRNVVLIGHSIGCNAIIALLNQRFNSCRSRVRASVQLFDMHRPLAIASNAEAPGLRPWYKQLSLAVFPTEQQQQAEVTRIGDRYTQVLISRDARPTHVLHDKWSDITAFIDERLATNAAEQVKKQNHLNGHQSGGGTVPASSISAAFPPTVIAAPSANDVAMA